MDTIQKPEESPQHWADPHPVKYHTNSLTATVETVPVFPGARSDLLHIQL